MILRDIELFKNINLVIIYLILLISFGCATSGDLEKINYDLNRLQKDNTFLKNEINNIKNNISGVVKEESFKAIKESQIETQMALSNLSKEIQTLSGRFEENKYFTEKSLKASAQEIELVKLQLTGIERQIKEINNRLNNLETQLQRQIKTIENSEKKADIEKTESEAKTPLSPQQNQITDAQTKYELAYNFFKDKKYKEARERFEAFIKEFPKHELSDNAHFWIGECYFNEKDYESAIIAYETFIKKYPKSKKIPSAIFKQAKAFIEIGDKKTGKTLFEYLIDKYPDSKEAGVAKKEIDSLKITPAKKKK